MSKLNKHLNQNAAAFKTHPVNPNHSQSLNHINQSADL
jgi:hypothetical protein